MCGNAFSGQGSIGLAIAVRRGSSDGNRRGGLAGRFLGYGLTPGPANGPAQEVRLALLGKCWSPLAAARGGTRRVPGLGNFRHRDHGRFGAGHLGDDITGHRFAGRSIEAGAIGLAERAVAISTPVVAAVIAGTVIPAPIVAHAIFAWSIIARSIITRAFAVAFWQRLAIGAVRRLMGPAPEPLSAAEAITVAVAVAETIALTVTIGTALTIAVARRALTIIEAAFVMAATFTEPAGPIVWSPTFAGLEVAALLGLPARLLGRKRAQVPAQGICFLIGEVVGHIALGARPLTAHPIVLSLRHLLAVGEDDAVVVLGVLEIIFRENGVTGRQRIAGERQILIRNRLRRSGDFSVGTVAVVGARERVLDLAGVVVAVIGVVTAPAATAAMLLSLPHLLLVSLSSLRISGWLKLCWPRILNGKSPGASHFARTTPSLDRRSLWLHRCDRFRRSICLGLLAALGSPCACRPSKARQAADHASMANPNFGA